MSIANDAGPMRSSPLASCPPEILAAILAFLDVPDLAAVSLVSRTMFDLSTPLLYSSLDCQNLTGTLGLLRRLSSTTTKVAAAAAAVDKQRSATSLIVVYSSSVKTIRIAKRPATHEVKAAIAQSLADAIQAGHLPNLRLLDWPFGYIRRGFLEDEHAARFDEPLWQALLDGCPRLETLLIASTAYQHPTSAIWLLTDRCRVILQTAHWKLRVNSHQRLEPL